MVNTTAAATTVRAPSPREVAADGIVHAVGLVAAVAGAGMLVALAMRRQPAEVVTASVYAFGLLAMLGCSAAYNLGGRLKCREFLRRLDHAAIFAMIAGTYTPFTILALDGAWSIALTAAVWSIAAVGIGVKLTGLGNQSFAVWTYLYLAFGWIGLVASAPLVASLAPPTLVLLVLGGVLYTSGTLIFRLRVRYRRAVWHGFVVVAAAIHFSAVFDMIAASG